MIVFLYNDNALILLLMNDTVWSLSAVRAYEAYYATSSNKKLECGPMPNVMVALPNIGGGMPQTNEMISAATGPKFTILWGHVEEILLLKGDMQRFFTKLMRK